MEGEPRTYRVEGLSCVDCAGRIRAAVNRLDAVERCEVDVGSGELKVWVAAPDLDDAPIAEAVAEAGYTLRTARQLAVRRGHPVVEFVRFLLARPETTLTAIAAGLTLLGLTLAALGLRRPLPRALPVTCYVLAILTGGYPVARHAYQELAVARMLGINALMVIAVTGAAFIGEWAEAAIVVVLFALGEALEGYATERARNALESLLDLMPPTALRLRPDGTTEEVPVEELRVGDRVRVRPGDRVSVDGRVLGGESAVDQSPITGESVPVDKGPGDPVFAGTVNTYGVLEVEVTRRAEDTTLSRMIALVAEAQARKAPIQRFVDRFARVYTPAVAVVAFLMAALPPLLFGQPFWGERGWLMRALQMLVIACPCALVISTPVSVVSALTNAARHGVLIKGGRTLEALGRVRVFAFDKTGTLTEGHPVTTDVLSVCTDPACLGGLLYAAAVESHSSHPLAQALVAEATARQVNIPQAEGVSQMAGRGITGRVNGKRVTIASHPYFDATVPHEATICREAERLAADGKTVMLLAHADDEGTPRVCALFAVADAPRPESREVLAALHRQGMRTVMLTGDGPKVAEAIGREVGVKEVHAGLLPEEKLAYIRRLQEEGAAVAFVGDGVNDAPALAQATVGVAMGGAGTDQAMESADVVLMGDDLRQLPSIVRLSHRTRRTIRANIAFALAVKAAVFVLAAAGAATLWMAIAADVGASLAVILSGMRLRQARV